MPMWPFRSKKLKSYLIDSKYKIILAFEHNRKKYYQFENAFDMSTGRGLQAMTIYEEFSMRVDKSYLEKHVKAIEILINDPKGIRIGTISEIHANLRERINLAPYPDHIYKLASVMFFDETESPFSYDGAYNVRKIAEWRADEEMLPFLVKVPLNQLMPFTDTVSENLKTYFKVSEAVNQMHQEKILDVLSRLQ
jgi:hypothetical protein